VGIYGEVQVFTVVAAVEVEEIVEAQWKDLGMPETLWHCHVKEFGPLIVSISNDNTDTGGLYEFIFKFFHSHGSGGTYGYHFVFFISQRADDGHPYPQRI